MIFLKHDVAKKALNALTEEFVLAGKATNEQAGIQLQKQYDDAYKGYNQINAAYKNGEKGITKTMVNQAKKRLNAAKEQLNIYSHNVGEEAKKAANNVGNNLSKTNSKENKEKAKKSGKSLTDSTVSGTTPTDEQKEKVKNNAKNLLNKTGDKEVRQKAKSKAKGLGNSFVEGFINVLTISGGSVFRAAWNFIKSALSGAKKAQNSNSPAKETEKLSDDYADGYIFELNNRQKDAYAAGHNFVKKAVAGAKSIKNVHSVIDLTQRQNQKVSTDLSYNLNSNVTSQLLGFSNQLKGKSNTPKVYTSSPVITLQFGDVKVENEQDIRTLSEAISYQIADEIKSTNRARGG